MPNATTDGQSGTCFVVMGFGKKTDFETKRVLDMDASYQYLIKPAVEAAKLKCVRADEIVHSGLIDVPMYEQLLKADIVVADLSTSNRNAIYELGVRHALRPYTTVIIAEDEMLKSPFFDLNHIVIRTYRHLGEDIGVGEMKRFTGMLTQAIKEIMAREPKLRRDSPVYEFLRDLTPPSFVQKEMDASDATPAAAPLTRAFIESAPVQDATHSALMQQVDAAQKRGDFLTAKALLASIREMRKTAPGAQEPGSKACEDPDILHRLALVTYKSKFPTEIDALNEARTLLAILEPSTSSDPETLGLWGAVHKRLWDSARDTEFLDESIRAYERGFYLCNDYYNGINFAFLLNVRAAIEQDSAEAIADFVQARRVRKEVVSICEQWLAANPAKAGEPVTTKNQAARYWVLATLAEAQVGLKDEVTAGKWLTEAEVTAPEGWMAASTKQQLEKLRSLLAMSPLERIQPGPAH
ncbi:MAG TPA: TRAFs-binding domain-containing protein [Chthoniobacteraceae bacterium]|nr:TRAFs-binding domain-containing protein [Chthoniobacteraceae bacterium]